MPDFYLPQGRARNFKLTEENRAKLRRRFSQPIADKLFADAQAEIPRTPPKTRLAQALGYLLGQKPSLGRCLSEARARIGNNLVDLIARLPDHPMKRIAELLPHA